MLIYRNISGSIPNSLNALMKLEPLLVTVVTIFFSETAICFWILSKCSAARSNVCLPLGRSRGTFLLQRQCIDPMNSDPKITSMLC